VAPGVKQQCHAYVGVCSSSSSSNDGDNQAEYT
jgi:hypothetical protein